ncbi:LysR family transcriptional regulator [Dyella solisilvae]|uniref:LysR family transcriptional regulator n=1 Tax=Dyella solisilvae TaxID=1920168 RepID=A0A370K9Q0_9GAMM|nr:LysR family transcriptional regulator [Dyella solisilvae]RDI99378.1 LysR family transcriptional regulator [Dyella solisilvae]
MDINQLKTFEAVVRLGSMSKAAAELHTVQSNVTTRIQALEDELGILLLQRHARGVSTTPAGQRFLPFAGRIMKLLTEAQVAATDDGVPGGLLALGGMETTTALRLSPVLIQFARTYPGVRLTLRSGTTADLTRDVILGKLDGAFVAGPVDHPDLAHEAIFTEELVLVTSPAIQSLRDLTRQTDLRTIVFQSGCSYRQRLETCLSDLGAVVAKPLEFGSLDAILSCVAAGVGVTLLPRSVVSSSTMNSSVRCHDLPRKLGMAETLFVFRRDAYVSSAMATFIEMSRKFWAAAGLDARAVKRAGPGGSGKRKPATQKPRASRHSGLR